MNEDIFYIYQSHANKKLINFDICGITYPDKNYEIKAPASPISRIEYIVKGSGIINSDNHRFNVCEGDTYFLSQGHNHHYYSDPDDPFLKYFINISGSMVDKLVEGFSLENSVHFKGLDTRKELSEIIALAKNTNSDNTLPILSLINTIFYKMHSFVFESEDVKDVAHEMREFLDTKITEKFRLDELCGFASLSEAQVIRVFKKAFNTTPYAYLIGKKIAFAEKMLINTNLSIKQIAYELCFADEYYFSNVFKDKTGMYPKSFRETHSIP